MTKKFISVFVSIFIILNCFPLFTAMAANFSDLSETHWAYENIMQMVDSGIVNGYEDGTFKPEGSVTRGEMWKMMALAKGISISSSINNHWAEPYGEALKSHTTYYEDWFLQELEPNIVVNRAEVSMLLSELHHGAPLSIDDAVNKVRQLYKDADNIGNFAGMVFYATNKGLMNGYEDGCFHPERELTRAELCTIICRAELSTSNSYQNSIYVSAIAKCCQDLIFKLGGCQMYLSSVIPTEDNELLQEVFQNRNSSNYTLANNYFLEAKSIINTAIMYCDGIINNSSTEDIIRNKAIKLKDYFSEMKDMNLTLDNIDRCNELLDNEIYNLLNEINA